MIGSGAVLAGIVWWGVAQLRAPRAYEFVGNVEKVGDAFFAIRGQFTDARTGRPFAGDAVLAEARVTPETRVVRDSFRIPSPEELKATGGRFEPDKLPREQTVVDLNALREDSSRATAGAVVKAGKNIYGKAQFDAVEVVYRVPLFGER
jgi:hypothetical protein